MKKFALFIVAVALVGGVFYVSNTLTAKDEEGRGGGPPRETALVAVAQVERRPMTEIRSYPGTVVANESVAISPKVTGLILSINVELGDAVRPGDTLITIDDAEFVKRLHQAEANLELSRAQARRAETAAELARREFERLQRANNQGLTTEQALDSVRAERESAVANLEVAKAEVARAEAQVEETQINVENTTIVAPLAGRVQARNADPGELATSSSPILTIVDADPAEVIVYLPERDLHLARVGGEARVRVRGGDVDFAGKIARVSPGLRETSRTAELVISVPNEELRLWPGMSADVDIVAREEPSALAVPSEALVFLEDRQQLFVVEEGIAKATPVELGIESDGYTQIVRGVQEGDLIVTQGQFLIRDGEEVTYPGDERAGAADRNHRNTD